MRIALLPALSVLSLALFACGGGSSPSGAGGATSGTGGTPSTTSGSGSSTGAGAGGSSTGAGAGGSMPGHCPIFPADNAWNTDISAAPVDDLSDVYVATIGGDAPLHPDFGDTFGIPFVNVDGSLAKSPVTFDDSPEESDPGPYPIPQDPPIEQDGDAHLLMIHTGECKLYELYATHHESDGWHAGSGAIWDLSSNQGRPAGWTSADAAGLPIFPGLARWEEANAGAIKHALRFTVPETQRAYVAPASHFASDITDASYPPMGLRMRLKKSFDQSGYPPITQPILTALKTYGMILADNGSPWFISGAPSAQWVNEELDALKQLKGSDFEAIKTGPLVTK
ncbi:MAG: hypothetical protein U0359_04755 [Byssovorax sp.]